MDVIDTVVVVKGTPELERAIARDNSALDDKDELNTLIDTLSVDYPQKPAHRSTIVDTGV